MASPRSDNLVIIVVVGCVSIYVLANLAVANIRMQQLGPLCAVHGWQLIDNGLGGPAKCLDPKTGLMYLPPEVFNLR